MLSDEEMKAIEDLKDMIEKSKDLMEEEFYKLTTIHNIQAVATVLNLIEKQSKEIEELKEDRKKYAEEYIHDNPWLYKQLNENYMLRVESEQKEKQAYIAGTNVVHNLCNKKWEDKIKAKIEWLTENILENDYASDYDKDTAEYQVIILQSLLEKE